MGIVFPSLLSAYGSRPKNVTALFAGALRADKTAVKRGLLYG
jgi:hypothetical protein